MPTSNGKIQQNAIRHSIAKLCMSTAVLTVLSTHVLAQQVVADGTDETVPADTIIHTTAPYEYGSGFWALNGGTIIAGGPISIRTEGYQASGIVAASVGKIDFTGADIETLGDYASGIVVSGTGSSVTASHSAIQIDGYNAMGAYSHMGTLVLDNVDVTTNGNSSHGVMADYSGTVTMSGGSVTTNEINAYGLLATQTDALLTANDVKVTTHGDRAIGAAAVQGGTLTVNRGEITTYGTDSFGVHATDGSANLTDTVISTQNAHGIVVQNGGYVDATNVTVTTTGNTAHGATAIGAGSTITALGGSYSTSGINAAGIEARNGGHAVIGYDPRSGAGTVIHTTGNSAVGVLLQNGSSAEISGATVITDGNHEQPYWAAAGILAVGGSSAKITDTVVKTNGVDAGGVVAEGSGSRFDMVRGSIHTTNENAAGAVAFGGGTANLTNVVIVAENARGITAGDVGSVLAMNGGSILAQGSGNEQSAVMAVRGGTVNVNGVSVRTENANARGLHAFNPGSTVAAVGTAVTTLGAGSHGGFASGGGAVTVTDSGLITEGVGSHGLVAQNGSLVAATSSVVKTAGADSAGVYLRNDSMAVLDESVITTANGPALQNGGGDATFDLKNGTQAVGGNGTALTAAAGSTTTVKADGKSYIGGDMVAEADDAMIDASLTDGSQWFGAAKGVTRASVDGTSYWQMTGSSDVGSLTNDGIIDFDAANPYKTLTAGSLAMNGGSFILNTKLNEGGAASETDRIVVTGDATGNGLINVRNNGGTGAFTGNGATDGIQVVEVGGASDAEFKLGSAAIVGIYDYQLKKADGQNWYLQTQGSDVVDPPACTPGVDCPGDGNGGGGENPGNGGGTGNPGPGTGHVVDIVPGYNIALSAAQNHVLTSLDTFHERLGELRAEELQDGYHAWMRGIGKTGSYSPKSITGYNGHGFDMTTAGVQIGADYSKSDVFVAGDKLTVGIFGEYANSSFDVRGRTADGSISSKGLGGYVTWQQKAPTDRKPGTGAYVDAVVKQDWLEFGVNAKSVSGFDLQNGYKGKATTASIEAGYGFDLGNNVVLQPQAQLTWSKVKADSFTDPYGIAVHGQEAESLIGRVGVRLEKTFYFGDEEEAVEAAPVPAKKAQKQVKGKKGKNAKAAPAALPEAPKKKKFVKSVTTFADANVKREFKGRNGLVASNTGIGNDMGGTRADIGVGIVARVSENVSLFGRGAIEFGGSTNVAGKVSGGLKITW